MRILFMLMLMVAMSVSAAAQPAEIVVSAKTDKADALYSINEPVVFLFDASTAGEVKYRITLDGKDLIEEKTMPFKAETLKVKSTLDKPGFLRCDFKFTTADKSEPKSAAAGAAFEPTKIVAAATMPEDFDAFWGQVKKQLAYIPINPTFAPIDSGSNGVDAFDVTMDCIGKQVRAYYARPKGALAKSCPAIITLHGAGVMSARRDPMIYFADNGFIALDLNAHGVLNGQPKKYYDDLYETSLKNYRHFGKESQYTSYFTGMFTRVLRGLEFLKAQPEWNGKVLVAYGASQGGAQSLAAAGLDSDVNFIYAGVCAMCDHSGHIAGWPKLIPIEKDGSYNKQIRDASMYNDGVNFARRAKARAIFTTGFVDTVVRPTSAYAAYNSYQGPKEMLNAPANDHPVPDEFVAYAKKKILEFAAENK